MGAGLQQQELFDTGCECSDSIKHVDTRGREGVYYGTAELKINFSFLSQAWVTPW